MRRRDFLTAVAGATAGPLTAFAQRKTPIVGHRIRGRNDAVGCDI